MEWKNIADFGFDRYQNLRKLQISMPKDLVTCHELLSQLIIQLENFDLKEEEKGSKKVLIGEHDDTVVIVASSDHAPSMYINTRNLTTMESHRIIIDKPNSDELYIEHGSCIYDKSYGVQMGFEFISAVTPSGYVKVDKYINQKDFYTLNVPKLNKKGVPFSYGSYCKYIQENLARPFFSKEMVARYDSSSDVMLIRHDGEDYTLEKGKGEHFIKTLEKSMEPRNYKLLQKTK